MLLKASARLMVRLTFLMPASLNVASTTNVAIGTPACWPPADAANLLQLGAAVYLTFPVAVGSLLRANPSSAPHSV
jgi:hypothetical protein